MQLILANFDAPEEKGDRGLRRDTGDIRRKFKVEGKEAKRPASLRSPFLIS
jgi:hypothetical protein